MLKIYNSLSKTIEEFSALDSAARVYTCGPTVYDHIHIGNLSSFIFADNLNRALRLDGYKVQHIMNITDVDDKTIKRSRDEFPEDSPEEALNKLTSKYENTFKQDMDAVGNSLETLEFIKATDSIQLMQSLIVYLIDNGFAYIADDGIYFSIEAYQKDGKKYGQLIELEASNTSKARINNDEYDKQNIHDFALWKFNKSNEPAWPFQIEDKDYLGRPGWHIECSAMSMETLGAPFDIHTGGIDLIFPHHENEIAQSTAGKENPTYAKYFIHNEHLLIDKRKMSKSLGNIFNMRDVIEKNFNPLSFRLLTLQGHYRNQSNFSWELLDAAQVRLLDIYNFANLRFQTKSTNKKHDFAKIADDIKSAFLDDLNTPKLLAILSDFQNEVQDSLIDNSQAEEFEEFIKFLDSILGLKLTNTKNINIEQKSLIDNREIARSKSDWHKSDEIRDTLLDSNIAIRDTKFGPIWYLV